jgi:hypothetical protein
MPNQVTEDVSKRDNGNISSVAEKLAQTTVTVIENKETAVVVSNQAVKNIELAFTLQTQYDNASMYQKDVLHDGTLLFLKAQCQRAIGQWDNAVTKASKMQKYQSMGRPQVEAALKIHPLFKPLWDVCQKAVAIKLTLK